MSPAERLRAAEGRLREAAAGVSGGPWAAYDPDVRRDNGGTPGRFLCLDVDGMHPTAWPSDMRLIALMSPPVALAVADWLGEEAAKAAERERVSTPYFHPLPALAVADAILGAES